MDSTRLHEQFSFKMQCMGTERHKRFLKPIKAMSYFMLDTPKSIQLFNNVWPKIEELKTGKLNNLNYIFGRVW